MLIGPSRKRRHVVLQIISIPMDFAPGSRGFVPLNKRIVSICVLVDDGYLASRHSFHENSERLVLAAFWAKIKPYDAIIGQHGVESDFAMLRQRTFVHGLAPETERELQAIYSHDVIDIDTHWGFRSMAFESGFHTTPRMPKAEDRAQMDLSPAIPWTENSRAALDRDCQSRVDELYARLQLLTE